MSDVQIKHRNPSLYVQMIVDFEDLIRIKGLIKIMQGHFRMLGGEIGASEISA